MQKTKKLRIVNLDYVSPPEVHALRFESDGTDSPVHHSQLAGADPSGFEAGAERGTRADPRFDNAFKRAQSAGCRFV